MQWGVGIPGTGMVGLPHCRCFGSIDRQVSLSTGSIERLYSGSCGTGKAIYCGKKRICISLKENITEKLYIEVICRSGDKTAKAVISGGHTTFIYIAMKATVLLDRQQATTDEEEEATAPELNLHKVYDFALTAPLDEIRFILDTARLNKAAAEQAFKGSYGHSLGRMLRGTYEHKVMGDSVSLTFFLILRLLVMLEWQVQ